MRRPRTAALAGLLAAGVIGCGDDGNGGGGARATPDPSANGDKCERVTVPGHEAVDVRASGVSCEVAMSVAAAAEGRGRRPYEADGFTCEPSEAAEGDTSYACTRGEAGISFRWGTA